MRKNKFKHTCLDSLARALRAAKIHPHGIHFLASRSGNVCQIRTTQTSAKQRWFGTFGTMCSKLYQVAPMANCVLPQLYCRFWAHRSAVWPHTRLPILSSWVLQSTYHTFRELFVELQTTLRPSSPNVLIRVVLILQERCICNLFVSIKLCRTGKRVS